ncbi:MAG: transposase [Gemmataceae bacterium]
MPRRSRHAPGGFVYHVLNRAVARHTLFQNDGDYQAFERVFAEALAKHPMRVLAYCVMPNHWHFVLWPERDGDLTVFLSWLTLTHTMRWHAHHQTSGSGHLYQGRFKSFPIETDDHLYTVLRYVEQNPLRAQLVARAEQWRWSSLYLRASGDARATNLLHAWPLPMPRKWTALVNAAQTEAELARVRQSVKRGSPYGTLSWQQQTARVMGLEATLRPLGRPRKDKLLAAQD